MLKILKIERVLKGCNLIFFIFIRMYIFNTLYIANIEKRRRYFIEYFFSSDTQRNN